MFEDFSTGYESDPFGSGLDEAPHFCVGGTSFHNPHVGSVV